MVTIYGADFKRSKAHLIVATCPKCKAYYYPDAIHCLSPREHNGDRARNQRDRKLLLDVDWYPVSRHGIWVHQNIAHMLHCSTKHLKSSWGKFTTFFNNTFFPGSENLGLTSEQVYHLYVEHFSRTLLQKHGDEAITNFSCLSNSAPNDTVQLILDVLGKDGGCTPGGKSHTCEECMHPKVYNENTVAPNPTDNQDMFRVAGINDETPSVGLHTLYLYVTHLSYQIIPDDDQPSSNGDSTRMPDETQSALFTRAAVMDGKTLVHRVSQIKVCNHVYKLTFAEYRSVLLKNAEIHWRTTGMVFFALNTEITTRFVVWGNVAVLEWEILVPALLMFISTGIKIISSDSPD